MAERRRHESLRGKPFQGGIIGAAGRLPQLRNAASLR